MYTNKQSETTSNNTKYRISNIKTDIEGSIKFASGEKIGGSSSIPKTITMHPLPISNQRLQEFIDIQSQKSVDEVIKDEFLPSVFHAREIRESADTPPQVRLQTCQMFINKVIGDKIDITQQKQVVDINKLIDQAMAIRSITQDKDVIDKSPVSCKDDNNE
jgi:hypothetical protein